MRALLAVLAALLCSVQCVEEAEPFTVQISTQAEYAVGEPVGCKVILTNNDDRDYYLLGQDTPLEGLMADIFTVSKNGKVIPYDSIMVHRGPTSEEEYVFIKAKSSLPIFVYLSDAYSYDSTGVYTAQLEMNLQFLEEKIINPFTQRVVSNMEVYSLTESQNMPKLTMGARARQSNSIPVVTLPSMGVSYKAPKLEGNFPACEKDWALKAYQVTYPAIERSIKSVTADPELYKEWFGEPYSGAVKAKYEVILNAMETTQYTLHAYPTTPIKCTQNVNQHWFGYAYMGHTTIYLCKGYFDALLTGPNSKVGALLHQLGFAAAYLPDVVLGQAAAKKLAKEHPEVAIDSADNYQYFTGTQISM